MSEAEYRDSQELTTELKDKFQEIEYLGEELKEHQEDIEELQESLRTIKTINGTFNSTDTKLEGLLNEAIQTRDSSVETCKEKLSEVGKDIESTQENLKKSRARGEERVRLMEQLEISVIIRNDRVVENLRDSIETQQDENQEVEKTENKLKEALGIIGGLLTATGMAATGIASLLSTLKNIGIIR